MKKQFTTLLNKEMDRKDFLKYLATAGLMAMGGGLIIQSLGNFDKAVNGSKSSDVAAFGYGNSSYGGKPTSS